MRSVDQPAPVNRVARWLIRPASAAIARPTTLTTLGLLLIGLSGSPTIAAAENWPCWRGPRGDGTSHEQNVPVEWNTEASKNLLWKVKTPGEGHASPIVWGDRIFLSTCVLETRTRVLVCLDSKNGDVLWKRAVIKAPLETKHNLNSYASSTPATDGESVFVTFLKVDGRTVPARNVGRPRPVTVGEIAVAAYDFNGNQKWIVYPGEFISAHGFCSSPLLFKDFVIVNGDHDGDSYLFALDRETGETVWKTPRRHQTRSYVTPLIREAAGRTQMVLSGDMCVSSYDPHDGSLHWTLEGPAEQFVASMVFDGSLFYLAAGYPTHHVMALRPDGKDDITKTHVVWHSREAKCYVPSPVVVDGFLVVADDRGTANCFDTSTGNRLWQERLGRHFSTSLVTANGLVYLQADDGIMKVIRPGPTLEVIAENVLGEFSYASPAIADGKIYLRGERHLFCIGDTD